MTAAAAANHSKSKSSSSSSSLIKMSMTATPRGLLAANGAEMLARAAQARRRQRVSTPHQQEPAHQRQQETLGLPSPLPPSTAAVTAPPSTAVGAAASSSSANATAAAAARPPKTTPQVVGGVAGSLIDRSTEAGEDAAKLLASLMKQQQQQWGTTIKRTTTTTNSNDADTNRDLSIHLRPESTPQRRQPKPQQATTTLEVPKPFLSTTTHENRHFSVITGGGGGGGATKREILESSYPSSSTTTATTKSFHEAAANLVPPTTTAATTMTARGSERHPQRQLGGDERVENENVESDATTRLRSAAAFQNRMPQSRPLTHLAAAAVAPLTEFPTVQPNPPVTLSPQPPRQTPSQSFSTATSQPAPTLNTAPTTTTRQQQQNKPEGAGCTVAVAKQASNPGVVVERGIVSFPLRRQPTAKKSILLDAACFPDHAKIMIQSNAHPTKTIVVLSAADDGDDIDSNNDDHDYSVGGYPAGVGGSFLGRDEEVLQIVVVPTAKSTTASKPPQTVVCFGDKVTLQWKKTANRAATAATSPWLRLGVQPRPADENDPNYHDRTGIVYNVGFYPPNVRRGGSSSSSSSGKTSQSLYQWIVFHASAQEYIKVGRAALEEDAVQRVQASQATSAGGGGNSSLFSPKRPVRSGDPVVFRNCQTGGVLSCGECLSPPPGSFVVVGGGDGGSTEGWSSSSSLGRVMHIPLQLLTDAYRQPRVATAAVPAEEGDGGIHLDGEPSLLMRLQKSDKLVPSVAEIFTLRQSTSPSVPMWMSPISSSGAIKNPFATIPSSNRCFLNNSYLWSSNRHESTRVTQDLDTTLFGPKQHFVDEDGLGETTSTTATRQDQMQSPNGQELMLLDELIGACMGLEGRYIRAFVDDANWSCNVGDTVGGIKFCLVEDDAEVRFDVILRRLVEDMLPLPTLFARVRRFVAQHTPGYEYGSTMQALCETLNRVLEKCTAEVVAWQLQYRKKELTISILQAELRSSMHSMSIVERACNNVRDKKGGALINALRHLKLHSYEGDEEADHILQLLIDTAAVPFMTRLLEWLEQGVLADDPHQEFMIQRKEAKSWESMFVISTANVLKGFFPTKHTVDSLLAAGRYWNAVRSCVTRSTNDTLISDVNDETSLPALSLQYSSSTATVSSVIQIKYQDASRALLSLLMDDYDLLGALHLMKRYFLMDHGDFFVKFLDCAEEEMQKDMTLLSRNRIQHWMNSCLQVLDQRGGADGEGGASIVNTSRRKDVRPSGLRCRFADEGLSDHLDKLHAASGGIDTQEPWTPLRHTYGGALASSTGELTGLDTFYLDFATIPFPTSIVLSPSSIECYQLLFRHLFFAKHVERRLVSIWKDHQMMKELHALRGPMGATFLLRQRMLHFLQNLIYYIMFEVIEPNWLEMEKAIGSPYSKTEQTVDEIIRHHNQFLHRALEACLLTNRDLVRALTKLLKTCLLFSEQMKRFMKATKIEEERNVVATEMQKEIQHNLNSRGGVRSSQSSDKYLHESLQRARADRTKRVQRQSARVEREVCGESYCRMVTRFDEVFSKNLKDFMVQLTSSNDLFHTHKVNLCIRLDYNGYITSSLGLV